uniref:Uncharacterized protein n=1 Tax=Laticauda laticaudata TaxID=8630 RepID=A0A8C5SMW4_LATLA
MKHFSLKLSIIWNGLLVLYSNISPSPFCVSIVFMFTTFPVLLKIVLSFILASEGMPGAKDCRFVTVPTPKFRTIIKT